MIDHNILFIVLIALILYIIYREKNSNVEHFVPGKSCTNIKATNFTNPLKLQENTQADDCTCNFPEDKVICSRYFSLGYKYPDYTNPTRRCHDKDAYNFEINSKSPDNSLCQYENNNTCIFPVSMSNINSLYDIIDNPEEYKSLLNGNGEINYGNILRSGPCIPRHKNRGNKLDLYFRLFNRSAINLSISSTDPIFNLWDLTGKINSEQLKQEYGKIIRTYKFSEDNLETTMEVIGYGLNIPNNSSYNDIVKKFNTNSNDKIKHIALAVSKDGSKYAIGISNTKDGAMDIAILNAILYEPLNDSNIDNVSSFNMDRSYTRSISLFSKASILSDQEYNKIKQDIKDNKIVDEENRLLIYYKDKITENITNPVGILMINNNRYFKYPNNSNVLDKCLDVIPSIETKCYDTDKFGNERNCNEVIMIRHDNKTNKCNVIQEKVNIIKNDNVDLSTSKNASELTVNLPIKIVNSMIKDYKCTNKDVDCLIYSINDTRFCKGTY